MSKKFLVRLLVGLAFLAAAVFYLLSALDVEPFTKFSLAWAGLLFSGVSGLAFLFSALATKNSTQLKKLHVLLGTILLIVAALCDRVVSKMVNSAMRPSLSSSLWWFWLNSLMVSVSPLSHTLRPRRGVSLLAIVMPPQKESSPMGLRSGVFCMHMCKARRFF